MSRTARTLLLASLALVPLLPLPAIVFGISAPGDPPTWRPVHDFDLPKWAAVSALVATALAVAALAVARVRRGRDAESSSAPAPAGSVFLALLVILAVASGAWAANPHESLRTAARYATLGLLYAVFAHALLRRPGRESLSGREVATAISLAAVAVGLYGLAQKAGWDFPSIPWRGLRRPVSTLGNTNIASEFLVVAIPFLVVLTLGARRRAAGWAASAGLAIALAHLAVTGTRAGWISLAVGLAAGGFQVAVESRSARAADACPKPPRLRRTAALAASVLGAALLLTLPRFEGGRFLAEAASIPSASHPSTRVRLRIWESSIAMIADRPWCGFGAGNFRIEYPRYRTPAEIDLSGYLSRVDTTHNDYLEIASELGIPGLGFWLGFAAAIAIAGARRRPGSGPGRGGLPSEPSGLHAAAGAAVIAFLVNQALRSPLHNPAAVVAFAAASALWVRGGVNSRDSLRADRHRRSPRLPVAASTALLLAVGLVVTVHWTGRLAADRRLRQALGWQEEAVEPSGIVAPALALEKAIRSVEAGLRLDPWSFELCSRLARYRRLLGRAGEAVEAARRALALEPNNPAAMASLAVALDEAGESDEAGRLFDAAVDLAPNHPVLRFDEGIYLERRGRIREAILAFEQSASTRPRDARTYEKIRECYQQMDPAAYRALIQDAHARKRLCDALDRIDAGRFTEAVAILREAADLSPGTAGVHWLLGVLLAREGDVAEGTQEMLRANEAGLGAENWLEREGTVRALLEDSGVREARRRAADAAEGRPLRR